MPHNALFQTVFAKSALCKQAEVDEMLMHCLQKVHYEMAHNALFANSEEGR